MAKESIVASRRRWSILLICLVLRYRVDGFTLKPQFKSGRGKPLLMKGENSMAVLKSFSNFHEDSWMGRATSFSIKEDLASGVIDRKISPEYMTSVKVEVNLRTADIFMRETIEWGESNKVSSRRISLLESKVDIDSIDASYSLDMTQPIIPAEIFGTNKNLHFVIEQCVAINDDARVRSFTCYNIDRTLARVVICEEERVKKPEESKIEESKTELGGSYEANKMLNKIRSSSKKENGEKIPINGGEVPINRESVATDPKTTDGGIIDAVIVDPETGEEVGASKKEDKPNAVVLKPCPIRLYELVDGVWLGDIIARQPAELDEEDENMDPVFGSWSMGLQKVAYQWKSDLTHGVLRQVTAGQGMGTPVASELVSGLTGRICVDESPSRDIPKDERFVLLDWNDGDMAGFILKNMVIQVPRYLSMHVGEKAKRKPFWTELAVFQSNKELTDTNIGDKDMEICCSLNSRAHDADGKLKQGASGFFTLKTMAAISREKRERLNQN